MMIKSILSIGFGLVLAQAASAADTCFYFSGSSETSAVHRVSVRGDVLTVKLMGPRLNEIRGLACTYKVSDISNRSTLIYKVN